MPGRKPYSTGQYTSIRLTDHLALEEILPSIGSVGDAFNNALMESINDLYKVECIHTSVFHGGHAAPSSTSNSRPLACLEILNSGDAPVFHVMEAR